MDITNFIRNGVIYPIGDAKSRESIATAFDSTASYSAGDYVMYDGTLYKFTSSHSGNWNPSHAEATCVTNELGSGSGGGNAQVMYYYQQPVNTATNAEIFRITNSKINTDTVVLECTFANPEYITGKTSWISYEGYIAFTGTCTTATTANVTMAYKSNDIVTTAGLDLLYDGNPTANTNISLITGKKFSDYKLLVISTGTTSINRFTYTIPISSDFFNPDNNNWIETEAASIWSLNFKYVSDTSFRIQDKGSSIGFVRLYGDNKYNYTETKSESTWTKAGSATNTDTVTVPETATEIMATVQPGTNDAIFSNYCLKSALKSIWYIGGYYMQSGDYAIINLNVSNSSRTFQLRNVIYGNGVNLKTNSTLTIYYK